MMMADLEQENVTPGTSKGSKVHTISAFVLSCACYALVVISFDPVGLKGNLSPTFMPQSLIRFSELKISIPVRGSGPDWFRYI